MDRDEEDCVDNALRAYGDQHTKDNALFWLNMEQAKQLRRIADALETLASTVVVLKNDRPAVRTHENEY